MRWPPFRAARILNQLPKSKNPVMKCRIRKKTPVIHVRTVPSARWAHSFYRISIRTVLVYLLQKSQNLYSFWSALFYTCLSSLQNPFELFWLSIIKLKLRRRSEHDQIVNACNGCNAFVGLCRYRRDEHIHALHTLQGALPVSSKLPLRGLWKLSSLRKDRKCERAKTMQNMHGKRTRFDC